nr:hypothetical protein [uncultured Rhodoferax sp.]
MRFRVTSISSAECGTQLGEVTVRLEDFLNALLSDGDFGPAPEVFMLTIVAVDDDASENFLMTPRDKLARNNSSLSLAVPVAPSVIAAAGFSDAVMLVSQHIRKRLLVLPKRVPKGFDCERCFAAISAALAAYVPA